MHRTPDSQFAKVRADARLQGLHRTFEKICGAPSLKACRVEFERFCQVWNKYPWAIAVWKRCFAYVEQLFEYLSAVRKIMYTTNAIEAVKSSFRKVTKRGTFPNDNSVFKLLYLRIVELQKKFVDRPIANWSLVRNQLLLNNRLAALFDNTVDAKLLIEREDDFARAIARGVTDYFALLSPDVIDKPTRR